MKEGAKVAVNYSSDSSSAESFIMEAGGSDNAIAIQGNAGAVSDIEKMVNQTIQKFGQLDVVIPNAGVLQMKDLENTSEADFEKSFTLNVKGPYFLAQKAAPHMKAGGRIIFMSTTQCIASTVTPPYLLYNSTKGAIEQMTRVISKDLGRKGILVNAVSPGPTATDLFLEGKSEALLKTIAGFNPFNKIGVPVDIANAMMFLAGEHSGWTSGQIVRVNGAQA